MTWGKNIEEFERCGGRGILVPRPWNAGREIKMPVPEWLDMMLDRTING